MPNKENDEKKKRPFATGSKPGPDYLDQFLEEKGFYRKHVARDASSLFRVVSEQVFDIQKYHEKVRQDCAAFMERHIRDYANEVDKNFYNYLSILRRSRTHGTLLELRVIARMYKRNVILFEPTQNMETMSRDFIKDDEYDKKEPLRVFYSHKDKHFDTIYPMETVERLAECQSIIYEILYTDVFKLPDVKYAVERMLHDQDEKSTLPLEDNPEMYKNANGEIFEFDPPEKTNCVLKDPRTCHFHNQVDFEEVVNENKDAITIINRSDDPGKLKIFKPIDGYLYKKDKSCVRQLLDENITPFPYKVAKALDPCIYRNTEFELWSENRKEQRLKLFDTNGFPTKENDDQYWNHFGDYEKNRRNDSLGIQKFPFDTPIIDEDMFLSIDEKGKQKYVFCNAGGFNLSQITGLEHFEPPRDALNQIIMPASVHHHRNNFRNNNRRHRGFHHHNNFHHNNNYHHGNNMNYVGDIERDHYQYHDQEHQMYPPQQPQMQEMPGGYQYFQYDQNSPPTALYSNPPPPPQYQYIPQSPFAQPLQTLPAIQGQMIPYTYAPPTVIPYPATPQLPHTINPTNHTARENQRDQLNHLIRENEMNLSINWSARESTDPNGNDLPSNDVQTLQFFYNIGVRYYQSVNQVTRQLESVANQLEAIEINPVNDQNGLRSDPPPVPVNTPVSVKPPSNIGSGHRYHNNNNHNGNRRVFHNQNSQPIGTKDNKSRQQHNQQRKEIQFNSNVKNVHKVDQNNNNNNNNQVSSQTSSANMGQQVVSNNLERTSSVLSNNQLTGMPSLPISPVKPETANSSVTEHTQQITVPPVQLQPQYFQQYPAQNIYSQPAQPIYCYQNENGELMPLTPSIQPVYYAPQTPIFYQPSMMMDGTMNSSDSGVVDVTTYSHYQPPTYPYVYQPPTPIFYPQTPLLATPQLAPQQYAPVYPVVNGQATVMQTEPLQVNEAATTGLNDQTPPSE